MTPKRNFIGRDLGHHPRRYLFISDFHKGYWQAVETELNSTMGWLKKNKKEEKKYIKYYGQLQVVPNPPLVSTGWTNLQWAAILVDSWLNLRQA